MAEATQEKKTRKPREKKKLMFVVIHGNEVDAVPQEQLAGFLVDKKDYQIYTLGKKVKSIDSKVVIRYEK